MRYRLARGVLVSLLLLVSVRAQTPQVPLTPPDANAYAVIYLELRPSARGAALAAFKQYVEASGQEPGRVRIDVLEQIGRAGYFTLVERWADAKAMLAHAGTAHAMRFRELLQPMRLSGYDERAYVTLSTTPGARAGGRAIAVVSHVDTIGTSGANPPALLREFAEASRKDEGNLRFDVMQSGTRRNHFTVFEVWRDQKAHDAHAAAAHTRQFRETITPMTGSPLDERLFKIVE